MNWKIVRTITITIMAFAAFEFAFAALTSWSTKRSTDISFTRQVQNVALLAKGTTDNELYYIEVDPVTGGLAVTLANDTDYGTVGANTLRTAAQIGNATGPADFGSGVISAQTLRAVLATDQPTIPVNDDGGTLSVDDGGGSLTVDGTVAASNFPATVDTDTGASTVSTIRVVSANNSPAPDGRAFADSVRNDYSSVNVTTGAWVELIASTAADIDCLTVFDSSGETLELGTGTAASETRVLLVPPGGHEGCIPLRIASGTRLAVRAVSGTASSGELTITGLD